MAVTAVTININSVQEYIFHSNKLKENIGASQITDQEFFRVMMTILNEPSLQKNTVEDIGGGGALVTFDNDVNAKAFIKKFSREILLNFPGLKTTFALISDFDFSKYSTLKNISVNNKNAHYSNTSIQKHGITADCPFSNESAEELFESKYISNVSLTKINAAKKSLDSYSELFNKHQNYTLTTNIDELGQNKEASYIAVVHIDGNGMGSRFEAVKTLEELKSKSEQVKSATKNAMYNVLEDLIRKIEDGISLEALDIRKDGKKVILPIRPILSGGDDITFVCEGRLGAYLAENFIRHFTNNGKSELMDGACAGVAIVKTKFPFFKAYELAHELCSEAKEKTRGSNNSSYISYYYSATTFSGSLAQLRKRTHQLANGKSMYYGPYNVFDEAAADSIKKLKDGINHFQNEKVFPKNKVMKLREAIAESNSSQALFLKEIAEAELLLPGKANKIWEDDKTPFFDQIELMDFYLTNLLQSK